MQPIIGSVYYFHFWLDMVTPLAVLVQLCGSLRCIVSRLVKASTSTQLPIKRLQLCSCSYVRVKYFPQNFTRNQKQLSCGFYHGLHSANKIFLGFSRIPVDLHFLFLPVLFLVPPPAAAAAPPDCWTFRSVSSCCNHCCDKKVLRIVFGDQKMTKGGTRQVNY